MATDDNKAHGNLDNLYCELISKQFRTYESISSRRRIVKKFLAQNIRMTDAAGHALALDLYHEQIGNRFQMFHVKHFFGFVFSFVKIYFD